MSETGAALEALLRWSNWAWTQYPRGVWVGVLCGALLLLSAIRTVLGRLLGLLLTRMVNAVTGRKLLSVGNVVPFPLRVKDLQLRLPHDVVLSVSRLELQTHLLRYVFTLGHSIPYTVRIGSLQLNVKLPAASSVAVAAEVGVDGGTVDVATAVAETVNAASSSSSTSTLGSRLLRLFSMRWRRRLLQSADLSIDRLVLRLEAKWLSHALVVEQRSIVGSLSKTVEVGQGGMIGSMARLRLASGSVSWTFGEDVVGVLSYRNVKSSVLLRPLADGLWTCSTSTLELDVNTIQVHTTLGDVLRFVRLISPPPPSASSFSSSSPSLTPDHRSQHQQLQQQQQQQKQQHSNSRVSRARRRSRSVAASNPLPSAVLALLPSLPKLRVKLGAVAARLDSPCHVFDFSSDVVIDASVRAQGGAAFATLEVAANVTYNASYLPLYDAAQLSATPLCRVSGLHCFAQATWNSQPSVDMKLSTTGVVFNVAPIHAAAHAELQRMLRMYWRQMAVRRDEQQGEAGETPARDAPKVRTAALDWRLDLSASLNSIALQAMPTLGKEHIAMVRLATPSFSLSAGSLRPMSVTAQASSLSATSPLYRTAVARATRLPLLDEFLSLQALSARVEQEVGGERGAMMIDASTKSFEVQVAPELVGALLRVALHSVRQVAEYSSFEGGDDDDGGNGSDNDGTGDIADEAIARSARAWKITAHVSGSSVLHLLDMEANGGAETTMLSFEARGCFVARATPHGVDDTQMRCDSLSATRCKRLRSGTLGAQETWLTIASVEAQSQREHDPFSVAVDNTVLHWTAELHLQLLEFGVHIGAIVRDAYQTHRAVASASLGSTADAPQATAVTMEEEGAVGVRFVLRQVQLKLQFTRNAILWIDMERLAGDVKDVGEPVAMEITNGAFRAGSPAQHMLQVPHLALVLSSASTALLCADLKARRARWSLPYAFDFGYVMDEVATVGKAIATESARLLATLAPGGAESASRDKAATTEARQDAAVLELRVRVVEPTFELLDHAFQARVNTAFGIFKDELAERALREELLERRIRELTRLAKLSDAAVAAMRAELKLMNARIYCDRVRKAKREAPRALFTISTPLLTTCARFDVRRSRVVRKLRRLNRKSRFFPTSFDYAFEVLVGMKWDMESERVVLHERDIAYPWILATGVKVRGFVAFAEEAPKPESLVHWTVHASCSRALPAQRTATNIKIYHDLRVQLRRLEYSHGVVHDWYHANFQDAFILHIPENLDTHQLNWWDKMRFAFHGRLSIAAHKVVWRLQASLNPYRKTSFVALHATDAIFSARTNELELVADYLQLKVSSQSQPVFDTKDFRLRAGMEWQCRSDADDHLLSPMPCYEGPFEVDASRETQSPSYLDSPLELPDPFLGYRATGLVWDLDLRFAPVSMEREVVLLDSALFAWFLRFGNVLSFPEMAIRPPLFRPSRAGFFSSLVSGFKLRVRATNLSVVFWESRDVKDPAGIRFRVDDINFSTGFMKHEDGSWHPLHGPLAANGIQAVIFPPEDYVRFYELCAAQGTSGVAFGGTFFLSTPSVSLQQDYDAPAQHSVHHFTVQGLKLALSPPVARLLSRWKVAYSQFWLRQEATSASGDGKSDGAHSTTTAARTPSENAVFGGDREHLQDGATFFSRHCGTVNYLVEVLAAQVKLISVKPRGAIMAVADHLELHAGTNEASQTLIRTIWKEYEMYCAASTDLWYERNHYNDEVARILTKSSMEFHFVSSSSKQVLEGVAPAKGVLHIIAPSVSSYMNDFQYHILSTVFEKFLVDQSALSEQYEEQLQTIMFKLQLAPESVGDVGVLRNRVRRLNVELKDLQSKLRDLEEEQQQQQQQQQGGGLQLGGEGGVAVAGAAVAPASSVAPDDGRLRSLRAALMEKKRAYQAAVELLALLHEAQKKALKASKPLPTWNLNVHVSNVHWHLMRVEKGAMSESLFCEVQLRNLSSSNLFREDDSGIIRLEVNHISILNHLPNVDPKYLHALGPLKAGMWSERDVMLRIFAQSSAPVGGISVYDHFEVNVSPLRVSVTNDIYRAIFNYMFFKPVSTTGSGAAVAALGEGAPQAKKGTESRGASVAALAQHRRHHFSDFFITPEGDVYYSYDDTEYDRMRNRAHLYRFFLYVKITDVALLLTFRKGVMFDNLKLSLHAKEYRTKAWSIEDLIHRLKKEVMFDLFSQTGSFIKHSLSRRVSVEDMGAEDLTVRKKSKLQVRLDTLAKASRQAVSKVTKGRVRVARGKELQEERDRVTLQLEKTLKAEDWHLAEIQEELHGLKTELLFGDLQKREAEREKKQKQSNKRTRKRLQSSSGSSAETQSSNGRPETGSRSSSVESSMSSPRAERKLVFEEEHRLDSFASIADYEERQEQNSNIL